jgi:hypothetical protein
VNSLRGSSFSQFDLRLSKEFKFYRSYGVELIGEIFNVLNSKNAANFDGRRFVHKTIQDPAFPNDPTKTITITVANPGFQTAGAFAGDPGQGEQRLAQLGVRITF